MLPSEAVVYPNWSLPGAGESLNLVFELGDPDQSRSEVRVLSRHVA